MYGYSDGGATDAPGSPELRIHRRHDRTGQREPEPFTASGRRRDERIEPDNLSVDIDERSAQSLVFSYMMARSSPTFLSPNILALTVAADVQDVLERDPSIDLQRYLEEKYRTAPLGLYVMLKDGRVAGNSTTAMPDDIRRATAATLAGNKRDVTLRMETTGPIVTSPIQIDNQLRGIVVLPPPPPGGVVRAVGRARARPRRRVRSPVSDRSPCPRVSGTRIQRAGARCWPYCELADDIPLNVSFCMPAPVCAI